MSLEKKNQAVPTPPAEKKSKKLCYAREFLLSLSKLDVCNKLPSGFDASVLSQFEDASGSVYERRPLLQNRSESSGGYGRGGQGRWETRSSGSSDKDGDMQPDREPLGQDTGRRFGNQTRRFLPNSEHDGLLGSGAFPRPSGYPAPNAQGNGPYQLKKSTEPYQPPRPSKAAPYSRKDFTDSYNDETFGSAECSSEDRAEEERKRRASFELMRKEQQKTLQEKHKANPENRKENLDVDIFALLGNSEAGKSTRIGDKSDETVAASLSHNDYSKSSLHIPTPAARPLVPPGFTSAPVEKNLSVQSSSTSHTLEAGSGLVEKDHSLNIVENDKDKKSNSVAYTQLNMEKNEAKSISDLFLNANEKPVAPTSSAKVLEQAVDSENVAGMTISIQETSEVWVEDIGNDFKHKNETISEVMITASQDHSTTILEKLFSSALSFRNSPNAFEHQGVKIDEETCSPELSESSKFARRFPTEEKKPMNDFSSRGLLSLINEKVNTHVSASPSERAMEPIPTGLPLGKIESVHKLHSFFPISSVVQKSEPYSQVDKKGPCSAVLTCEDLEQSILAEATDSTPSLQQPTIQVAWAPFDGNLTERKIDVDDHASQHLLSLLQKGTSLKESISSPGPDLIEPSDRIAASKVTSSLNLHISDNAVVRDPEMVRSSEKSITLETIFGSAFMNELHSAEAPVSAKRDPVATVKNTDILQHHALEFPHADGSFFSSICSESRSSKIINKGDIVALNNTQKDPNLSVAWIGDSSIEGPKLHGMGIEEGGSRDVQLPEEDSLFTVGDTLIPVTSDPFPFENAHNTEFLRRNNIDNLNNRLFGPILGDGERRRAHVPEGPPPLNDGPFVDPDSLYNHLHGRPSTQYPHQINHTRPLFPPLDHLTQRNALMKFVGPDGLHHDPHNFPGNVIPQHAFSNVGARRFDPAVAHHPMLQHMPVPGNCPPHHPMQGLPGGIMPSQAINHMPSYIPDMNNMDNFSVHHRQSNYGGLGMGLPESVSQGSGDRQPEALTRLIEMETRANSKHNRPAGGGHIPGIPGIYNPELDMNFRYR